jgi:DNA-binding CsgD family transcriptional regulator
MVEECFQALMPYKVSRIEAEVAAILMRSHATDEDMAAALGISVAAVKKRLRLLREKLGCENRRHAAALVYDIVLAYHDRDSQARGTARGDESDAASV